MKHLLVPLLLAAPLAGWAALGGAPASGGNASAGNGWQAVQRQLDSGTTVREYADAAGTVFAVSWSGPFLPDLRELLGPAAFARYTQAQAGGPGAAVVVQSPDLVLLSGGRMGAFQGRAWLPARVPAGVDPRSLP